jgi:hypothetical protein
VPRVNCASHGVRQLRVPWAEAGPQFTALFERLAIDLLRECSVTGGELLRITWDEAWGSRPGQSAAAGRAGGRRSSPAWRWTKRRSPSGTPI